MSYHLTLRCGCVVHVSVRPASRITRTRIIQTRGRQCTVGRHRVGLRLRLWELLPDRADRPEIDWFDAEPPQWIA